MIAISSPKPHQESAEYARNQRAAHASWERVFEAIYYISYPPYEADLSGKTTHWVAACAIPEFPAISYFLNLAGSQNQWAAIINADIVVTEKLKGVVRFMEQRHIAAATSKRWNMTEGDMKTADVTDKGLDIFIARPWLWRQLSKMVPQNYRIGHCEWDTWVLAMLMKRTHRKMGDFTDSRCIFHPLHTVGERPYNGEVPKMEPELYDWAKMPGVRINV